MLGMQNPSGGFAAYENTRGLKILEYLNPAEVFGKRHSIPMFAPKHLLRKSVANVMVEHDYPECTTSVLTALVHFRQRYPHYKVAEIEQCTLRGIRYLHRSQHPNGGWYGTWAICFTYATMFALEGLSIVGETYANSSAVRRACDFLLSKQMADGGWGESYKVRYSCLPKKIWNIHAGLDIYSHASSANMSIMHDRRSHRRHGRQWR